MDKTLTRRDSEQFNGREGETATLLSRCLLNFNLRVSGFAQRHLRRRRLRLFPELVRK